MCEIEKKVQHDLYMLTTGAARELSPIFALEVFDICRKEIFLRTQPLYPALFHIVVGYSPLITTQIQSIVIMAPPMPGRSDNPETLTLNRRDTNSNDGYFRCNYGYIYSIGSALHLRGNVIQTNAEEKELNPWISFDMHEQIPLPEEVIELKTLANTQFDAVWDFKTSGRIVCRWHHVIEKFLLEEKAWANWHNIFPINSGVTAQRLPDPGVQVLVKDLNGELAFKCLSPCDIITHWRLKEDACD